MCGLDRVWLPCGPRVVLMLENLPGAQRDSARGRGAAPASGFRRREPKHARVGLALGRVSGAKIRSQQAPAPAWRVSGRSDTDRVLCLEVVEQSRECRFEGIVILPGRKVVAASR